MADMEKVIKGMEMCISQYECSPDDCPYYIRPNNESGLCWDRLMMDALALLKEQQEEIENLKQTAQSMMEGIFLLKEQDSGNRRATGADIGNTAQCGLMPAT